MHAVSELVLVDRPAEAICVLTLNRSDQLNAMTAELWLALALRCDIRYAAREAVFRAAFINIGVSSCDMGTSGLLPRVIGASRSQERMLTGRRVDAEEALRSGLVADVVDGAARLE